jgi:hypothetical protein
MRRGDAQKAVLVIEACGVRSAQLCVRPTEADCWESASGSVPTGKIFGSRSDRFQQVG